MKISFNKEFVIRDIYMVIIAQAIFTIMILGFIYWKNPNPKKQVSCPNNAQDGAMLNMLSSRMSQIQADLYQIKAKIGK